MIRRFLNASEYSEIRVLVGFALLSSFVQFFYNSGVFSLQIFFVLNFLVPLICSNMFLAHLGRISLKKRFAVGIRFCILIGGTIAAFYLFLGEIHYYFLGGREIAAEALGHPVSPITFNNIVIGIQTRIIIWFILTFLSGIAGILAVFLATIGNTVRKIISKAR